MVLPLVLFYTAVENKLFNAPVVHQRVAACTLDGHAFLILTNSSSVNLTHCWPLLLILQTQQQQRTE
jgi:hypothetical protein